MKSKLNFTSNMITFWCCSEYQKFREIMRNGSRARTRVTVGIALVAFTLCFVSYNFLFSGGDMSVENNRRLRDGKSKSTLASSYKSFERRMKLIQRGHSNSLIKQDRANVNHDQPLNGGRSQMGNVGISGTRDNAKALPILVRPWENRNEDKTPSGVEENDSDEDFLGQNAMENQVQRINYTGQGQNEAANTAIQDHVARLSGRVNAADDGEIKRQGEDENGTLGREYRTIPDFSVENLRRNKMSMKVDPTLRHDKWIVVTSIRSPTPDVMFLSNLKGWKVVVVGDTKTPADWRYPNCVFLSVTEQESLGLRTTPYLSYKTYQRKNVGYLYAIAHGAKVIYETDDDNRPVDQLHSFQLQPFMSGLMFAGTRIFNPYRHYGQPTLWPRGYFLGAVGDPKEVSYRLSDSWRTPLIQQGLVNGDPDMDAIFRLTRKKSKSELKVTFDPAAPPVVLPEGAFSPYNSQNTLFLYDALWSLALPPTTTFRICDIWRGYWAQRLLWEMGGHLGFFPPNAYQIRNAHSYMADAEEEKDMYFDTERLVKFLTDWSCPRHLTFFQCVYKLTSDMADQRFLRAGDVNMMKAWLEDLLSIGYPEPKRVRISTQAVEHFQSTVRAFKKFNCQTASVANDIVQELKMKKTLPDLDIRWSLTVSNGTFVDFVPAQQESPIISISKESCVSKAAKHAAHISSFCPNLVSISMQADALVTNAGSTFYHDVLLVIVFNRPHYETIRHMEVMYRHLFPNIAYCGKNSTNFYTATTKMESEFTFIDIPFLFGDRFSHLCVVKAMQMGYNVTGYMVTGDDVLLNTWKFHDFDKKRMWSNFKINIFNTKIGTKMIPWETKGGSSAYGSAMNDLKLSSSVPSGVKKAEDFRATLAKNAGPDNSVHTRADFYYIPSRLKSDAVFYLSHFAKFALMPEVAIPMTFLGLESRSDIQYFAGKQLSMEERQDPWTQYSTKIYFLHPVRFSTQTQSLSFCSEYLMNVLQKSHAYKSTQAIGDFGRHQDFQQVQKTYLEYQDMSLKKPQQETVQQSNGMVYQSQLRQDQRKQRQRQQQQPRQQQQQTLFQQQGQQVQERQKQQYNEMVYPSQLQQFQWKQRQRQQQQQPQQQQLQKLFEQQGQQVQERQKQQYNGMGFSSQLQQDRLKQRQRQQQQPLFEQQIQER